LIVSIYINTIGFSYRGLTPHKLTPMPGVHDSINLTRNSRVRFFRLKLARAGYASR
jgi:hypothetical protein